MASDKTVNGIRALLEILGVVFLLIPWIIFTICEMQGSFMQTISGSKVPITCGWTNRAETGVGALIVIAGGLHISRNTLEACRLLVYSPLRWESPSSYFQRSSSGCAK